MSARPGGTSADPASPFYLDLLRPYLTKRLLPGLARETDPEGWHSLADAYASVDDGNL